MELTGNHKRLIALLLFLGCVIGAIILINEGLQGAGIPLLFVGLAIMFVAINKTKSRDGKKKNANKYRTNYLKDSSGTTSSSSSSSSSTKESTTASTSSSEGETAGPTAV